MNRWLITVAFTGLVFAAACGDDDGEGDGAGGSGGSAGASGGSTSKGGSGGGGSTSKGGSGGSGGSTADAGAGGQGDPVMCDPPAPPMVGAGGASGGEGGGAGASSEGGATGGGLAPLAIAGEYVDAFDGTYVITSARWENPPAVYHISAYDNEARWVVARNDEGNMYDPCSWSRYDWVETNDGLFYCTTAYNADTEQEARDADRPDDSDPTMGGCGGPDFPWTLLTPQ